MLKRMISAKKKDVHLTILVDSSLDDFQKVIEKIRTEVRKYNHCPENKAKASYDIIYARSPEQRRCIKGNFCEEDDAVEIRFSDACEGASIHEAENVKGMEAVVAVSEGKNVSVERYHTEKELREVVMSLLDERVISVDITKRAPEQGSSRNYATCAGTESRGYEGYNIPITK